MFLSVLNLYVPFKFWHEENKEILTLIEGFWYENGNGFALEKKKRINRKKRENYYYFYSGKASLNLRFFIRKNVSRRNHVKHFLRY